MTIQHRLQRLYQAAIAYEVAAHHAHGLRNVVGGISMSTFLIRRRLEAQTPARVDDRIRAALDVIDNRVQDAVALAAERPPLPVAPATSLVVADAVAEVLDSIPIPRGVRVLGPTRRSRRVVVGRDELELVLHGLVENAIDSVASNGKGTVRIRIDDSNEGVLVEVLDDGVGVDPSILDKIFRPFFSTKEGRLGMGLTVARGLVVRLGGRLSLESTNHGVRAVFGIVAGRSSRARHRPRLP